MADNNKVPEDKVEAEWEFPAVIMMYQDDRINGLLQRATAYQIATGSFSDGQRIVVYRLERTGTIKAGKLVLDK